MVLKAFRNIFMACALISAFIFLYLVIADLKPCKQVAQTQVQNFVAQVKKSNGAHQIFTISSDYQCCSQCINPIVPFITMIVFAIFSCGFHYMKRRKLKPSIYLKRK